MKEIQIFTDGSSLGNPGRGGWAALIVHDGVQKIFKGHAHNVTNNQMELTAAIEALLAVLHIIDPTFTFEPVVDLGGVGSGLFETSIQKQSSRQYTETIILTTDSEYVRRGVTERLSTWIQRGRRRSKGGKIIENVQLRQTLSGLSSYLPNLRRQRTKGHAGHPFNELVDQLAREEAAKGQ